MSKQKIKAWIDSNVWDGEDRSGTGDRAYFQPDELQKLCEELCDDMFIDIEKENIELRQANADNFSQREALKRQLNYLNSKNRIVGKNMVNDLLEMIAMIRNAPNDVTRNHCLDSTVTALKEVQSAAQRILDKENE